MNGSLDSTIKIWCTQDWTIKKSITTPSGIRSLLLLNSSQIAVVNIYRIQIYDINAGFLIFEMTGNDNKSYIRALVLLNDNQIISGSDDKTLKLWDITTGKLLRTIHTFKLGVVSLLNLNNGFIAVGLKGFSSNIAIIRTDDWKLQSYLTGHDGSVNSLISLSNGSFASGSEDNKIIIWNK